MPEKIGILVQARMSSSRLPGKSLRLIGENPLIWYVVQRVKLLNLPVIVCTSKHPSDNVLCDYLRTQDIPCYRGSLENVLQRYIQAAEKFEITHIVRATGDNPLIDIDALEKSLVLFEGFNYVDAIYENGFIKGTGFELVKLSELKSIKFTTKRHLEHVTLWLRENIEESDKRIQLQPEEFKEWNKKIFLTCDYEEDLRLLKLVFEHFNYRVDLPIKEIVDFLSKNIDLCQINAFKHN